MPELGVDFPRDPVLYRARVLPMSQSTKPLQRTGWLTPYAAEMLAMDLRRMSRGARLEITVAAGTSQGTVRRIGAALARLLGRSVAVELRCDGVTEHPFRVVAAGTQQIEA